ncbi:MAG: Hpt domain-containing protein, partial [Bacteroidetes bacterium]
ALHRILHACWQETTPAEDAASHDEPPAEAPPTCTEPPTFDRTLFERFRDVEAEGDLDFVHSLLHQFLDEAQEMLTDMRRAFQDGDLDTVRFLAHKLASSSRLFGACRLSSLCRDAELGTPTPALLDRMWAEFEAAAACLREACAPGPDGTLPASTPPATAPPSRRVPSRQRA